MEKLDKVIAGLRCCQSDADCEKSCPYFKGWVLDDCTDRLRDDALEVLSKLEKMREDYECGLILHSELPEMLWVEE
jgi:hypothetical protein